MTLHKSIPGRPTYRGSLPRGRQRSRQRRRSLCIGQKGGFAVGLVVGLLIGLVLSLGVALYVTKVPLPFINKVPQRTAEQDAAEVERNKNWDPNSPLAGKPAVRGAASGAAGSTANPLPLPAGNASAPARTAAAPAPAASAVRPAVTTAAVPPASAPKPLRPGVDPLIYFAQAGAYTRADDAEAQRAKLALLGMDAKVTERDQSGRTIYRVRIGPFDARAQAEAMLERLQTAGVDSTLVRVERQ
jgi:cell division protein FtsN